MILSYLTAFAIAAVAPAAPATPGMSATPVAPPAGVPPTVGLPSANGMPSVPTPTTMATSQLPPNNNLGYGSTSAGQIGTSGTTTTTTYPGTTTF